MAVSVATHVTGRIHTHKQYRSLQSGVLIELQLHVQLAPGAVESDLRRPEAHTGGTIGFYYIYIARVVALWWSLESRAGAEPLLDGAAAILMTRLSHRGFYQVTDVTLHAPALLRGRQYEVHTRSHRWVKFPKGVALLPDKWQN